MNSASIHIIDKYLPVVGAGLLFRHGAGTYRWQQQYFVPDQGMRVSQSSVFKLEDAGLIEWTVDVKRQAYRAILTAQGERELDLAQERQRKTLNPVPK